MQSGNIPSFTYFVRLGAFAVLLAALGTAACASTTAKGEYEVSTGATKKL